MSENIEDTEISVEMKFTGDILLLMVEYMKKAAKLSNEAQALMNEVDPESQATPEMIMKSVEADTLSSVCQDLKVLLTKLSEDSDA